MPVIAVINRKGGSGKSTLATHLAAFCATTGKRVMLGDVDRQQSAQTWLKLRGAHNLPDCAAIQGWAIDPRNVLRVPAGVTHVVLDTPGGMRGFDLARIVMNTDVILMPVCNSVFDRESAAECFAELKTLPRVAGGRCKVAAIGMRLDARTRAGEVLAAWAKTLDLPFIGVLRETQAYVRCIELGLTLFDVPATQVRADLAQWRPILQWLDPVLDAQLSAAAGTKPEQPVQPVSAAQPGAPARPVAPAPRAVPAQPAVPPRAHTLAQPGAADQPVPARPMGVSRPVVPPLQQTPRAPAPATPVRPRPVLARAEPVRPAIGERLGQLLDTLPIPRFLQRNP